MRKRRDGIEQPTRDREERRIHVPFEHLLDEQEIGMQESCRKRRSRRFSVVHEGQSYPPLRTDRLLAAEHGDVMQFRPPPETARVSDQESRHLRPLGHYRGHFLLESHRDRWFVQPVPRLQEALCAS